MKLDNGLYIEWDNSYKNLNFVNMTGSDLYLNYAGFIIILPVHKPLTPISQHIDDPREDMIIKNNSAYSVKGGPINGDRIVMADFTIRSRTASYALNYNLQNVNGYYRLFLVGDKTLFPVPEEKQ